MTSQLLTATPQWLESLISPLLASRWKHQDRPTQHLCQHQTATPSLWRSVMWCVCSKWGKQGRLPVQMVRQEGWWKCANHLSEVFTKIFKLSRLNPSSHPAAVVPAPKKTINNLLCVWEAGPTAHQSLPSTFKLHHFDYRVNRSIEDTITTALYTALTHLGHQGSYVGFCSAFNAVISNRLVRLRDFHNPHAPGSRTFRSTTPRRLTKALPHPYT